MSESEDDIWGYKSIRKKRAAGRNVEKTSQKVEVKRKAAKKPGASRNTARAKSDKSRGQSGFIASQAEDQYTSLPEEPPTRAPQRTPPRAPQRTPQNDREAASPSTPRAGHSGFCPSCQMPFSILLVQTPRWHVSECLDAPSSIQTECPDGLSCSSTIASHYKRFSHFLLAQSRADQRSPFPGICPSDPPFPEICPPDPPSPYARARSSTPNGRNSTKRSQGAGSSPAFTSQTTNSQLSRSPAGSQGSVKQTSLDTWLSTPTKLSQISLDLSQETPGHNAARCVSAAMALGLSEDLPSHKTASCVSAAMAIDRSQEEEDINGCPISYSPLVSDQELFSDDESLQPIPVRELFSNKSSANTLENVKEEFAASEHFIAESRINPPIERNGDNSTPAAIERNGVTCAADCSIEGGDWSECVTPDSEESEWVSAQREAGCWIQEETDGLLIPSNSDREAAPLRGSVAAEIEEKESCTQRSTDRTHIKKSLSQISSGMPLGDTAPSKGMKQMDIGVFFGLKPKSKPVKAPLKSQSPNTGASQVEGKRPRKEVSSLRGVQSLTEITGVDPAPSGSQRRKRKAVGSLSDADSLTNNTNGTQRREWKRSRQNSTAEETKGRRQCPFYKKIPGTGFSVDAFQYGAIEGCSAYFLTHFHSDHYGGLTKKFRHPIYCSKITGNLVASKLRVEKEFINTLPMDTECLVGDVRVTLLDANHCPGAVLLLFILPNGTSVLHTGDFRADTSMERYPALIGRKIHTLYLDTTYCSPEYTFPPQQEAIQFAVNAAFEMMTLNPRTLVVCGTYSVGKEKVFLAIADVLGCKVCMSPDKLKTMQCLECDEISARVTTDWHSTALHVLPMMQLSFKGLGAHLNKFSGKYDRVLAFKPTGWTYSEGCGSVAEIRPEIRGKITIYGIPYSEHSSYLEMKRFVQFTKPQKIIPTVNVGNYKARAAMEKHFTEWLSQSRRK